MGPNPIHINQPETVFQDVFSLMLIFVDCVVRLFSTPAPPSQTTKDITMPDTVATVIRFSLKMK